MMHNKSTQHEEEQEEKTLVLWDINRCPIPDGFDPRLVGRRIESALKNSECSGSGPLTITAIGDLRQTGDKVLRDLFSTGIALKHAYDNCLYVWMFCNPPPATVMLITDLSELEILTRIIIFTKQRGYRILLAYPQRDQARHLLIDAHISCVWERLLKDETNSGTANETTRLVRVRQDKCRCADEPPLSCNLCDFAGQSFDDFATHLKSVSHAYSEWDRAASKANVNRLENKPEPPNNDPDTIKEWDLLYDEDIEIRNYMPTPGAGTSRPKFEWNKDGVYKREEQKTVVWWHINSCPIPDGCDPRLVSQRIVSTCNKSGYCPPGPLTITAIGDLRRTSGYNVLRDLSSAGIALVHAYEPDIQRSFYLWTTRCNPSPATIMLISGLRLLEVLAHTLNDLNQRGYRILLAYPQQYPAQEWLWNSFLRGVSKEWLWKSLLEDEIESGTTRLVLIQDKCSEMVESRWFCSVCRLCAGQSFEDLAEHLDILNMEEDGGGGRARGIGRS